MPREASAMARCRSLVAGLEAGEPLVPREGWSLGPPDGCVNDTELGVVQLARGDRQLIDVGEVGAEGVQGPAGSIDRIGGNAELAEGDRESPHPDVR